MKRIAALTIAIASIIMMSNPAHAVPWDDIGHFLRRGAEKATEEGLKQIATNSDDQDVSIAANTGSGDASVLIGGVILAGIIHGIYRAIKR
jgi:hypothetical protein